MMDAAMYVNVVAGLIVILAFLVVLWRTAVGDEKYWKEKAEYYQDKADDYRCKWMELMEGVRGCSGSSRDKELDDDEDPADYWKKWREES